MITKEQLKKFAENCVGKRGTGIRNAFNMEFPEENFDDLSVEQHSLIDSIVFACDSCGLLCSNDEINSYGGDVMCDECFEEEIVENDIE